ASSPQELASLVGSFRASVLAARPNPAHRALAELEHLGFVAQVLTSNFDQLHQAAGRVRVLELARGRDGLAARVGGALPVVVVPRDTFGRVRAAPASGMGLVVLHPEVPDFVQDSDLYLPGRAEIVLPEVAELLRPEK